MTINKAVSVFETPNLDTKKTLTPSPPIAVGRKLLKKEAMKYCFINWMTGICGFVCMSKKWSPTLKRENSLAGFRNTTVVPIDECKHLLISKYVFTQRRSGFSQIFIRSARNYKIIPTNFIQVHSKQPQNAQIKALSKNFWDTNRAAARNTNTLFIHD